MVKRSYAVIGILVAVAGAHAQVLTGINWYTTDASKHYNGGYANTYGGDTYSRNLYVSVNQAVGGGPLVNSQNLPSLPTRVQIDLGTPGITRIQMYCNDESTLQNPFWGLNLFFDGDDLHPRISSWNVVNTAGFQAVNPVGTPTLDPFSMGLVQSAPGNGLDYVFPNGGRITLTAYSTWSTTHYNTDRVDNFSDDGGLGNGTKDNVIEFTLQTLAPVPEPSTMVGIALGLVALISRRASKRSRS